MKKRAVLNAMKETAEGTLTALKNCSSWMFRRVKGLIVKKLKDEDL